MMFAFTLLCVSFLLSFVNASPLSLRTVISPHITSPNETSVWPVGSNQFVTWDTANFPPDSQITNPNGKVVLGHLGPTGGYNLDLDHPLAQNFKLRVGKVQITVPDVPPREDYIVVLFGDSGNASPAFAITKITGGSGSGSNSSSTSGGGKSTSVTQLTSLITTPIPITGPTIPAGTPSTTSVDTVPSSSSSPTSSAPTATSPVSQSTTSGAAAPTQTNGAWSPFHSNGMGLAVGLASFVLLFN